MNCILIAIFLSILIHRGGGSLNFLLFLELTVGSLAILASGVAFFERVKIKNLPCQWLIYFVTGTFISSLLTYFISWLFDVSVGPAFVFFSIAVFTYVFTVHRKSFLQHVGILPFNQTELIDISVFLGLLGFTLVWCWTISGSFPTLLTKGVLSTWIDVYYHGSQIAQLFETKVVGQGDIFLAGVPPFSYHRVSYVLAAVISQAAHLPGLAAATALHIPIGYLLFAITTYCLGTALANRTVGMLSVIFLLILPDNSWLGLQNGFIGFHYGLQVAPGTAYGLAGCLISILFFVQWLRDKSIRAGLLAIFFACAVYFFRAHFFILYFPALMAAMLFVQLYKKKYLLYLIGFLISFGLMIACFFFAKKSVVISFLHLVHLDRGGNAYTDFYNYIWQLHQPILIVVTGIILLISGILGIWTIIYPLALWINVRQFGWKLIDYFPLILLLVYIGIVLFAPAVYQTPDELQHRPLGLVYAVFVIFSVFYVIKIINKYPAKLFLLYAPSIFIMCAVFGVLGTVLRPQSHYLHILFRGFSLYQEYQIPMSADVIKTAMFLRDKAIPGEYFLTSKDDTDPVNVDSAVVVTSIAGVPSYLGEQTVQSLRAEPARLLVIRKRDSIVRQSIVNAATREEALNRMRENRIAWYIALTYPKWDRQGTMSNFKSGTIAVYHS